jgi:hypothetical protein
VLEVRKYFHPKIEFMAFSRHRTRPCYKKLEIIQSDKKGKQNNAAFLFYDMAMSGPTGNWSLFTDN